MKLESEKVPTGEVRTNVDFVRHVENTLGFILDERKPPWKARQIEAGKLKRKRATDPKLYSVDNLLLTVEWLRRRRTEVKSPAAVCWFVEDALKNVHSEQDLGELEEQIDKAIAQARARGEEEWVGRLIRARGDGRSEALEQWRAHVG